MICYDWTDARVKLLKQYWLDGYSCSQIAALMPDSRSLTRNAVIGKVTRLGLPRRKYGDDNRNYPSTRAAAGQGPQTPRTVTPRRVRGIEPNTSSITEKPKAQRARTADGKLQPDHSVMQQYDEASAPSDFLGIRFLDLKPHHCRYPRGEGPAMLFCGQPKRDGSSYCDTCHRRCYGAARSYNISDEARERVTAGVRRFWARRRAAA